MSMIRHIVGKDFALLRGRLALWAAFVAAKFALGFWLALRADVADADIGWLQGMVAMFVVTDVALTLVCTMVLVQEDGVAGTHAFWRTRPIAGGRLLAAKVAAAGVLLVLPAVVLALPWWWVCGLTPSQTAVAAAQTAVWQLAVITVGFGAAAVSTNLGRGFVGMIAVGAGLILANGALSTAFLKGAGAPLTAALWQLPLLLPVLAAVAVVQFFTREARIGRRLIAAGVAAVLAVPLVLAVGWIAWPQPSRGGERREELPLAADPAVQVAWRSATMRFEAGRSQSWMAQFRFEVTGVPVGRVVGGEVWHEWRRADGSIERARSDFRGASGGGPAVEAVKRPEAAAARGAERQAQTLNSTVWLTPDQATLLRSGAVDYRARLRLHLVQPEVVLVAPATGGKWQARLGHGGRVVEVERTAGERKAQLLESEPVDAWCELRRALARTGEPDLAKIHVVHNPRRGFATTSVSATRPAVTIGGVSVRVRTLDLFNPTEERDGKRVSKHADWAETASVALVIFREAAALERMVAKDGLAVQEETR